MLAVIFALVFFFAGVSLKFSSPQLQVDLTVLALLLLLGGVVRLVALPQYLWGRPDPPPPAAAGAVVR